MKTRWIVTLLGLTLTPTLLAAPIALTPAQEQALGIETRRLAADGTGGGLHLSGEAVVPNGASELVSAPVSGVVQALRVERLQTVKAGQTLATLASSDSTEAQREYLRARGDARLAQLRLQRDEQLFKEGLIAQSRLEETRTASIQAEALLADRRAMLRLQGLDPAQLRDAASISAELRVSARSAGVVEQQFVTPGQRVALGDPLFLVVRQGALWLDLHAAAAQRGLLRAGQKVTVAGCTTAGRVVSVAGVADPATQTFLVRAQLPEAAACLSPKQFVDAMVSVEGAVVPEAATVDIGGTPSVFVRAAGGFVARPAAEVRDGEIVVKGTAALKAMLPADAKAP